MSPRRKEPEKPKQVAVPIGDAQPKRGRGRPTKFTEEAKGQIIKALKLGNTRKAASQSVGIVFQTFANWLVSHPDFLVDVVKAEAEAELRFLGKVAVGAAGWQSAAWWLERRRHEDYGRRDRLDMSLDSRKMAEEALRDAGLPVDEVSINRIVAAAERHVAQQE